MAFITVVPLWTNKLMGTGGTFTSDAIDMREICRLGTCSVNSIHMNGAKATAGSTIYSYLNCATRNGTFATAGTFATRGANLGAMSFAFQPKVSPFMKVRINVGTSASAVVTAELNVQ